MIVAPRTAMVLAAGLGTRLRPVTETIPKPLIEINGRSLLDHAIDRLALVGVETVIVNVHYKAALVAAQLTRRGHPRIEISHETELLDSGGGVARALPLLGDVFFVVNSDVFWLDGEERALQRLAAAFDPERGYEGSGDYLIDASGCPHRRGEREVAPFLFAGLQLLHRRAFAGISGRVYSLVRLFDRAEAAGRLRAIVHDGEWFHIGTPQGLSATRERLSSQHV
jgi:MurNAc alpha-1-phosphate uridylyltransferase